AVNHRHNCLKDVHVRRAIAHAINRDKLLDECFRFGLGKTVHRVLNGPYPAGSWACSPGLKADPYNEALARKEAKDPDRPPGQITLKYPEGDPNVLLACEKIRDQVKGVTGIELVL